MEGAGERPGALAQPEREVLEGAALEGPALRDAGTCAGSEVLGSPEELLLITEAGAVVQFTGKVFTRAKPSRNRTANPNAQTLGSIHLARGTSPVDYCHHDVRSRTKRPRRFPPSPAAVRTSDRERARVQLRARLALQRQLQVLREGRSSGLPGAAGAEGGEHSRSRG